MGDFLYQNLVEPRSADEDDRRRERILNVILVGSFAMLAVFDVVVWYYSLREGPAYHEISPVTFSVVPAFFVLLYALSRRGHFIAASYLLVAAYFVSVSYAAVRWGVNLPTAVLGYALLITIASILVSARFGFAVLAAVSTFILLLWHFQFHGLVPVIQEPVPNQSDALVFAVLLFLLATVAWLSNREMERSLIRARSSERALKEERDTLEAKVEERTRELRLAEVEKIDHLYRFAEFGKLASGLFHDMMNLLHVASLELERGGPAAGDGAGIGENMESIRNDIERFKEAYRRQLSRDDMRELFSLERSVGNVVQMLDYQAKHEGVRMKFDPASSDGFEYFGSPLRFHQVALNLILNAIESFEGVPRMPGRGRSVDIALRRDGGYVTFRVADSGCGIPVGLRAKIFEPFFTTKAGGRKGIGIGLAMTKRIVEKDLGGTIAIDSENGKGTVFTVRFPQIYGHQSDGAGDAERTRAHQGGAAL
ncbi:MAG TPA: HAMP domain-containing sensor histidine kinase [Candidatus Paceibacterota bacterium]|nr:HAMP domain-containing sensor histidine kinase [Candidatus Paceibacterota bacterium]